MHKEEPQYPTANRIGILSLRVHAAVPEVIDLAIEGQYIAIARVHHWLMATRTKVDDAQSIVTKRKTCCLHL